jgi:hypothetical protein
MTAAQATVSSTEGFAYVCQLALGSVFLAAAVPKLRHPRHFRDAVLGYELVPARAAWGVACGVLAIELLLGLSLLSGWMLAYSLACGTALVAAFAVGTWVNLHRGREVLCGCFGNAEERVSRRSLVRLGVLAAGLIVVGVLVWTGLQPMTAKRLADDVEDPGAYVLAAVSLAGFTLAAASWLLSGSELRALAAGWTHRGPKSGLAAPAEGGNTEP